MNFKIVLCKSAEVAKSLNPHVAIEAEWGSNYCEGSIVTMNHHCEAFKHCEPPCVTTLTDSQREQLATLNDGIIVISHFDLDTLGGILKVLNPNVMPNIFWKFAGWIDVEGVHNVMFEHLQVSDYLHAFWAWSEKNRIQLAKDQTSLDATDFVNLAIATLQNIEKCDPTLFEAGKQWFENMKTLETTSFKSSLFSIVYNLSVIVRESENFCNHLYNHEDVKAELVIAKNSKTGAVTISKRHASVNFDCCKFMQECYGQEAGGHAGIAGSPRNIDSDINIAISKF